MITFGNPGMVHDEMLEFKPQKADILFLVFSGLCFFFYGFHPVFDMILFAFFLIFAMTCKEKYFILLIPGLLVFAENITLPEYFGTQTVTLSRFFQIAFVLRILVLFLTKKLDIHIPVNRAAFLVIVGGYSFLSFFLSGRDLDALIGLVYLILFIYVIDFISRRNPEVFATFFVVYAVYCVLSGIYGLVHASGMISTFGGENIARFSGTLEPNFMGMYINFAVIAMFFIKFKKWMVKLLIIGLLYGFMLTTVSMTAFIVNGAIVLLILLVTQSKKLMLTPFRILLGGLLGVSVVCVAILFFSDALSSILFRVETIVKQVSVGQTNSALSGRGGIVKVYLQSFSNASLPRKLFGSFNEWRYIYNTFKASHNLYVDILYCLGVVGGVFYILAIGISIVKDIVNFSGTKQKIYFLFCCEKLVVLISGLTLSFFNSRMFYMFMLL